MQSHKQSRTEHRQAQGPGRISFGIDWAKVVGAGFLGTAMGVSGMRPLGFDMPKLLGTVISADPNPAPDAMLFGTLWNFANGIAFAIIYAYILKALARQSTILTGFLLGLVLWLLSMSALPILMRNHPLVTSGKVEALTPFFLGAPLGWTLSIFVLIDHLVYGALVGLIYRHRERIGAS